MEVFLDKPLPNFGPDLSGINFDAINYYVNPVEKPATDWDDVPADIKQTFEQLGVPEAERTARFHCVLVLMRHENDPTPIVCHGKWEGRILTQAHGKNGFGYDPLFLPIGSELTAAQYSAEMKKQVSHRGQALRQMVAALEQT